MGEMNIVIITNQMYFFGYYCSWLQIVCDFKMFLYDSTAIFLYNTT